MLRPLPRPTLFPYTTLFRSRVAAATPPPATATMIAANRSAAAPAVNADGEDSETIEPGDRKSTRLNSSHVSNSYAVFGLKKKKDDAVLVVSSRAFSALPVDL